jgi:nucleoside-diphosphate-sugar epimerase
MPDPFLAHLQGATVAVTGASGNLGTALLRRLTAPGSGVAEVRGLARRRPPDVAPYDGVRWHLADLGTVAGGEVLRDFLDGADAVVHLAWALQPGRHPDDLRRVNVGGTGRVVRAAAAAGVAHVVHMSSLGAYAPGAVGQQVTEDWPTPASRARSTAATSARPSASSGRSRPATATSP